MATCREGMLAAGTAIAIRCRTRTASVEAMGHVPRQAEQLTHDRTPFVTVGLQARPLREVVHQPVRHLVGHHIDEEVTTVFAQQHGIETQSAAAEVRLPGALATQVEPYSRSRQMRMYFPAQLEGRLDALMQRPVQRRFVEAIEPVDAKVGEGWSVHGMLECRPGMAASSPQPHEPLKSSESHDVRHPRFPAAARRRRARAAR